MQFKLKPLDSPLMYKIVIVQQVLLGIETAKNVIVSADQLKGTHAYSRMNNIIFYNSKPMGWDDYLTVYAGMTVRFYLFSA